MSTLADPPLVLRQCNGCKAVLRPATPIEIAAQRDHRGLPDVRRECRSCAPAATREAAALLVAALIAVRTGAVVGMPRDMVELAEHLASDLAAALRAVAAATVREGAMDQNLEAAPC